MMARLRLEVFQTATTGADGTVVTDTSALEEARLAAFEQGYGAGWEDAGNAQAEDQTLIRADLARNLQALSFTFHEAKGHVLSALEPLLSDILVRILPKVAYPALGHLVIEGIEALARDMADAPVTLVVAPAARNAIAPLLDDHITLPLRIIEEPSLGEGQVYLRLGDRETLIDLDRALTDITTAIRNQFTLLKEASPHGPSDRQQPVFPGSD